MGSDAPGMLAVDPGAVSGWAIYPPGERRPSECGQVRLHHDGKHTLKSAVEMRGIVAMAVEAGCTLLVIEGPYKTRIPKKKKDPRRKRAKDEKPDEIGWRTYHSMGVSFGRWIQVVSEVGFHVLEVNPRTWQSKTVGTGPREQQIPKYKRVARKVTGRDLPADASAAVVIGSWAFWERAWMDAVQEKLKV